MKKLFYTLASVCLLAFMACNTEAKKEAEHADGIDTSPSKTEVKEPEKKEPDAVPDSAAMAKAMQEYATPGEMHKWMASTDGKWEAEMVFWMNPEGPPAPPEKAKMESKMVLNGLYQESTYKGKMMGQDFEGRGILAYDNAKKKFISTWIDNMGSGVMIMEGDLDQGSKTLNMSGEQTDPTSGKSCTVRQVVKMVDDKHQVMEMYSKPPGADKESKVFEIKLVKK